MSEKNKARLGAATPERAKDRQTYTDTATNPAYKSTTSAPAGQRSIAGLLGVGRENAITRRDLERLTGLAPREVSLAVERERRSGVPILADGSGYYLPKSFFGKILEPGGTLTIQLYLFMQKANYDEAFAVAVVLLVIVLAINGLAKYLSHKFDVEKNA